MLSWCISRQLPPHDALAHSGNAAGNDDVSTTTSKPYNCRPCVRRKVKCNRATPSCSSCRKSKLECVYQTPAVRGRKRYHVTEVHQKLERYELILKQHGLLEIAKASNNETTESLTQNLEGISLRWDDATTATAGKLVTNNGRSRYVESYTWHNLDGDYIKNESEDDGEEGDDADQSDVSHELPVQVSASSESPYDPFTGSFLGSSSDAHQYTYPSHVLGLALWEVFVENVDPLCKVLHVPSTQALVRKATQQPDSTSPAEDCLLFAIYHFAVYSMSAQACFELKGNIQSREELLHVLHRATSQALVNASFLKTTDLMVLQAYVLFLLPCRYLYDPATYWILTGVAFRIGQRLGLHVDGEGSGLPPFEVEMRRRLFYQLLPLEGASSQAAGAPIIPLSSFATGSKGPLNINDDQIQPGMTVPPIPQQRGATEMIFCLVRASLGGFVTGLSKLGKSSGNLKFKDHNEADKVIDEAENEIEERFIRYCDAVDPLHFLTLASARSSISAMRLRVRLPKLKNETSTYEQRREMFNLSGKILDADAAIYAHPGIQKYWWYIRSVFLWGSWDSLIYVLTYLCGNNDRYPAKDIEASWDKVSKMFDNHKELLETKRILHVAIGRLALKAWDMRALSLEPGNSTMKESEPHFITILRHMREERRRKRRKKQLDSNQSHDDLSTGVPSTEGFSPGSKFPFTEPVNDLDTSSNSDMWGFLSVDEQDMDLDIDAMDWTVWDQLTKQA